MAKHHDQAQFNRSEWRLMVLLPCWGTQVSLTLLVIGISAYLFANGLKNDAETLATAQAWSAINIGTSALSLLTSGYEILRTVTQSLTPRTMLATSLIKLFGVMLSMIMDDLVLGTDLDSWAAGIMVIHSFLLLSTLALGSYAIWKWKCLAEYDDYHLPGSANPIGGYQSDVKGRGLNSHNRVISEDIIWDPDLEFGNEPGNNNNNNNNNNSSSSSSSNGTAPSTGGDPTPTTAARDRASSLMATDTAYDPVSQQMADGSPPEPDNTKRARTYSHTHDPSYADYVRDHQQKQTNDTKRRTQSSQRSASSSSDESTAICTPPTTTTTTTTTAEASAYRLSLKLKSDVDDVLDAAFGWGFASRSSSMESQMVSGQPPAMAVGGGAAPTVMKSVRDSLSRSPSDVSESGSIGAVSSCSSSMSSSSSEDEGDDDDDCEDDGGKGKRRRRHNVDHASRALLGGAVVVEEGREEVVDHPEFLRPGRPKSSAIAFVVTPPPGSSPRPSPRMTWGGAYTQQQG